MEINDAHKDDGTVFREREINAGIADIQRRLKFELYTSLLYNILFWVLVVAGIFLLVNWAKYLDELPQLTAAIVCLSLGMIVYTFNLGRFGEDETFRFSVVREFLQNSISKEHFIHKMQQRCSGAARITAQISMKLNVVPLCVEKNHWSKSHRSTTKEITYGSCTGKAFDVKQDLTWPADENVPCRITIVKIFKAKDEASKIVFKAQAEDFCKLNQFRQNRKHLHFEYLLGFTNEEFTVPLVETYLVEPTSKRCVFNISLYNISKLLALDSIYRFVFNMKTKDLGVFEIEKTIKHHESQA